MINIFYFSNRKLSYQQQNEQKNALNSLQEFGLLNLIEPFLPPLQVCCNLGYTLVLDLDETLVHFFYTPSGGTFLIRPYCFEFLKKMSEIYEIVIFTAATKEYADSILDIIDPEKKLISQRLYRQHTSICGLTFVKDLTKLGRDLSRTIIVDNLADNFKLQINNGIQCGTWIDDMKDTQLRDLGNILYQIVVNKVKDVKKVVLKIREESVKKVRKNTNANPFRNLNISKLLS